MWLDIGIAVLLLWGIIQGYRRGFVLTLAQTAGWLIALVFGFFVYPYITAFLREETKLYELMDAQISARIGTGTTEAAEELLMGFPEAIRQALLDATATLTDGFSATIAESLVSLLSAIIAFLIIVFVIKLVLFIITSLFSKRSRGGLIGGVDGILGLFAGGIKSLLIIYLCMMLLVPITSLSKSTVLADQLKTSLFADYFYQNNLFLTKKTVEPLI